MVRKELVLLVSMMICSVTGYSATIYVDNTLPNDCTAGNYSIAERDCSGSDGDGYDTIQEGVNAMSPGDTLYLRGGTYHEIGVYLGSNFWHGRPDAWYTISSYPGEWAIIDGGHSLENNKHQEEVNRWDDEMHIFRTTSQGGRVGYIRFEKLEIMGGGLDTNDENYPSDGSAIEVFGGPYVFRYLYIHDNYGKDNNNCAGLILHSACNSKIEFCRFRANGQIKEDPSEPGVRTTSIANVLSFADYAYSNPVTLYREETGYCTAMFNNQIRYNLFEADSLNNDESLYTNVGFKHKGMQRLTGYVYADQENSSDNFPNDDGYESLGDRVHHNIFLNHTVAIEIDQDYAQVYNNIIVMSGREGPNNAIQGRDGNSSRRGPFKLTVYNNTIIDNGNYGIIWHPVPDSWTGDTPYVKGYIYNNILDNVAGFYDGEDISVESDGVTANTGYPLSEIGLSRNYFYNPPDDLLFYIYHDKYTKEEIEATPSADLVFEAVSSRDNPLYESDSGVGKYITRPSHSLSDDYTIANGGIGGPHPYLEGVALPSYIGATNPNDHDWVRGVLEDVTNIDWLKNQIGTPTWVEGYGDVNQDGSRNIQDVQIVVNVILGTATNILADVNGDGNTNVQDVQAVINKIVNYLEE